MRQYCTYFDHHYLVRGLALYDSLASHGGGFQLWVLCLSAECEQALQKLALPGIRTISMGEFEDGDVALLAARQNRSRIEYFFTCTPSLPLFLFKQNPAMDAVTYLDGDLYFFGDPEEVHRLIGDASIAITPHRFPPACRALERFGIYNVGWVTFRRDASALACLKWWRERCLEWCFDRVEDGKFGDQKYLDDWPVRFTGVQVIQHPGVNLAPWNLNSHRLTWEGGRVQVDGMPLLMFHFHGLRQLTPRIFDPQLKRYDLRISPVVRRRIYRPYFNELARLRSRPKIGTLLEAANPRYETAKSEPAKPKSFPTIRKWVRAVQQQKRLWRSVCKGEYLFR